MKKYIKFILVILLIFANFSCEDLLTEEPYSFYDQGTFFENKEAGYSALSGVMSNFNGWGIRSPIYIYMGMTDNHLIGRDLGHGTRSPLFFYNFTPSNSYVRQMYQLFYRSIYRANTVMEQIEEATYSQEVRQKQIAEARFYRAYSYFHLVRLFGEVPLVTSIADVDRIDDITRTDLESIYQFMIKDFKFAAGNLPDQASQIPGRPINLTANAYLAEVYATRSGPETRIGGGHDEWQNAIDEATKVVQGISIQPTYYEIFTEANQNSGEILYSLQMMNEWGHDNSSAGWYPRVSSNGRNKTGLSKDFINAFEPGDERALYTFRTVFDDNPNYSPFADSEPDSAVWGKVWFDNILGVETPATCMILKRVSGVKLLLAEAINEQSGPNADAYQHINDIRERAGLAPLSGLSQAEFRDAVRNERRVELACEFTRYMDLKRWGILIERINEARPLNYDNFEPVEEFRVLLPFPQDELDRHQGLTNADQNPGY